MISFFSNWIEGIAIAVIIATIFEMLLPNGNIKKYVKIILGIYIILCMIAPFTYTKVIGESKILKKVDEYTNYSEYKDYSKEEKDTDKKLNRIYENTFEKDLIKTIEKEGFTVYKCNVKGNFNAEGDNAGISKINITIESKKAIKKKLSDKEKTENQNSIINDNNNHITINEVENVKINVSEKEESNEEDVNVKDINTLKKYLSNHYEIDKGIIKIYTR